MSPDLGGTLAGRRMGGRAAARAEGQAEKRRRRRKSKRKRPVLRFVILFGVFMGIFCACDITPVFTDHVFPAYLRLNARVSGMILNVLQEDVIVVGDSISGRFQISIRHGCDALLPTALFVSAVLASPVALRFKIPGVISGSIFILLMNLARIVTLFYSGIYIPGYFERMHLEVWPAIFIFLSLFLWVVWALWARDRTYRVRHAVG